MDTISYVKTSDMPGQKDSTPGFFKLLACQCPRCRRGDMFESKNPWNLKKTMKMNDKCAICGQPFNIEVGFYYGSSYVSYALSFTLCIATFIAWWLLIGFSFTDNRFFYWIAFNAVFLIALQPYLMRASRTIWLAFFAKYDPNWETNPPKELERTNKAQEGNW